MSSKKKLLLIDGHSIANRAFYGVPLLTNSSGVHTNAVMGFLNIFLSVYAKEKPDYVVVAFDVREKTFRHEMYPEYKGNRKGMPEELHEQIPLIKDALAAMGVASCELPGFEADDILGTLSARAEEDGVDVSILSGDRDQLQLASSSTKIILPKTKAGGTEYEIYYAGDVFVKYGATPSEFIDMKALMGDASDNIPGIPGIGEKTASNIISRFHSLENAYEHIEEITPNKARENLREYIEQGRMSKVLATINRNSPVELDYKAAAIKDEASFYNPDSYDVFKKLELNKLLSRIDTDRFNVPEEIKFAEAEDGLVPAAGKGIPGVYVAPDGRQLAVADGDGVVIYKAESSVIKNFIESGAEIVCFDLKKLLYSINAADFRSNKIYDLSVMAYLLNPLASNYTFDSISKDHLGRIIPSAADILGKVSEKDAAEALPEGAKKLAAYSSKTAFDAFGVLKERLEESGMWKLYTDIEMPLTYSLYYMERQGVKVNRQALNDFSAQLAGIAAECEKAIYEDAGEKFNISSPKQLGEVLFEKLKLPAGKKTKTGYSTSADILEKLADEFPIVSKILKYRQVTKLRSTYAEGLIPFIADDGRIHGSFNQTVTATGRISSQDPNLQNIPIRQELGQEIRRAFVPKEGFVFIDADYSQIELRLLAHLSNDKNLIAAYFSDSDIHRITAAKVFGVELGDVTPEMRRNAKAVNFGIVYGISSFGLSQDLSISKKQAGEYIEQYFESYPGIKDYLDETVRMAKINGYTVTMFARRRPIPELASSNFMLRQFGERAAMNSPIQGSAADIMKIAMINVDRALMDAGLKARIVLQIHDELLVEAPLEEADAVKEILVREMKQAVVCKVPLEVEACTGGDWLSAH